MLFYRNKAGERRRERRSVICNWWCDHLRSSSLCLTPYHLPTAIPHHHRPQDPFYRLNWMTGFNFTPAGQVLRAGGRANEIGCWALWGMGRVNDKPKPQGMFIVEPILPWTKLWVFTYWDSESHNCNNQAVTTPHLVLSRNYYYYLPFSPRWTSTILMNRMVQKKKLRTSWIRNCYPNQQKLCLRTSGRF